MDAAVSTEVAGVGRARLSVGAVRGVGAAAHDGDVGAGPAHHVAGVRGAHVSVVAAVTWARAADGRGAGGAHVG